ncbi:asparagine synthase-related protein [Anaerolineales bacterium HSG24]|nr:asparagine synthase-related protein [Anaerolineales bacterium HSG24]
MSGIFGLVDFNQQTDILTDLNKMAQTLAYRDWFTQNSYVNEAQMVGLGQVGIGILNQTVQPIWNESRTLAVVMTGEFYSHQPLLQAYQASSDEVLALKLYEKFGSDFAKRVEGAFIMAFWNESTQQLQLINDHIGVYPTYLYQKNNCLVFAPEVKSLLAHIPHKPVLRHDAVAEFIRLQRVLGQKTFFEDINLLPPATILTYSRQQPTCQIEQYWSFSDITIQPETITFDEAVEECTRLFRAAVVKRVKADERIGIFMSGGLDSRAVLGFTPSPPHTVHTFTFGHSNSRDVYSAAQIAKAGNAIHHHDVYNDGNWIKKFFDLHLTTTEGFHPWIHMHGIKMLKEARQTIDVNISGIGDLIWLPPARYVPYLINAPDNIAFNALFFDIYTKKMTWPCLIYSEERLLYHPDYYPHVRDLAFDSFVRELEPFNHLPYTQRAAAFNTLNHFNRHLLNLAVVARSHIEFRFPYFDVPFLSFCYGLPSELTGDRDIKKTIIIKEFPHLAKVPDDRKELPVSNDYQRRLIAQVNNRLKRLFNRRIKKVFPERTTLYADYENWLRTDLREWAETILFDERTLSRGIFSPEAIRSIVARHVAGHQEWTIGKVAHLITFEMMLRNFYDETPS